MELNIGIFEMIRSLGQMANRLESAITILIVLGIGNLLLLLLLLAKNKD